jgi:hypothetical protein
LLSSTVLLQPLNRAINNAIAKLKPHRNSLFFMITSDLLTFDLIEINVEL